MTTETSDEFAADEDFDEELLEDEELDLSDESLAEDTSESDDSDDDDDDSESSDDDGDEEEAEALDELEAEELEMLTEDESVETLVVDEAAEMRAIRRAEIAMDSDAADEASGGIADALTPDGFDAEQLRSFVDESDLGDLQKQAAKALITQAEENPEQVQGVIDQLKDALGL